MEVNKKRRHFVLVHGACHGAWTWYKLKPRLESAGHRVTALDLAASGINLKAARDVQTFYEYSEPLLEILALLPPNEKIVIVGHSLGGFNLALAMEKFPEKIYVAVFLTAFVPDTVHQPSYILDQHAEMSSADYLMDSEYLQHGSNKNTSSLLLGPKCLSSNLYQLCPIEDLELAKILVRPTPSLLEDLSKEKKYSNEGYGSVKRVFVVCNEDKCITEEFQRWMIQNSEVKEVVEIKGADHMPMFSKTQELCDCLLAIAHKYS